MPTKKHKYPMNRERVLLVTLVAVAFFGFLLWSIEQASSEEIKNLSGFDKLTFLTENKSIKVALPKIDANIKSPVVISGQASVFEAVLQIRIKDNSGLVLAKTTVKTAEGQKMSPFKASVKYKKPTRSKGTIEVFAISAKDGSEINTIKIPVAFKD